MSNTEEYFTFCIGRLWYPDNHGNIATYAYGRETFYGNMEIAKETLKFIQDRAGDDHEYHIYKLVKV